MATASQNTSFFAPAVGKDVLAEGRALKTGRLLVFAPDHAVDAPLYWQQWKLDSPALAAVTDAVTEAAAAALRR